MTKPNMATQDINVWVCDDDDSIRWVLEKGLSKAGMQVQSFAAADELLNALEECATVIEQPDIVLSDIRMPGMDGLSMMSELRESYPELPVIIMTAHSDLQSAVSAYEKGAFEYLPKPFDVDEAIALVERAAQTRTESKARETVNDAGSNQPIIGEAPAMQELFRAIGRLSRSSITVLITGESGTGKELVAHALHKHSPRAAEPFIALNTAAIPRDLLESELFGHERGAFTGAATARAGRFEQANGGSLFLDEIGDMPAELQTRLLRVLADGEFYRIGGRTPIKADVRIIAATHQDLEQRVSRGEFREDLLHRLNVIRVRLPALRERREDIPLLLKHFLQQAAQELQVEAKILTPAVTERLRAETWPGNVRQLSNLCRWLTVMGAGNEIQLGDLPPEFQASPTSNNSTQATTAASEQSRENTENVENSLSENPHQPSSNWQSGLRAWAEDYLASGADGLFDELNPQIEKIMIEASLEATDGHRQAAAKRLGWGRNTLTRKIQQLALEQ